MSIWAEHDVAAKITEVLGNVPLVAANPHALGRPYLTCYQIAIALDARYPDLRAALGVEVGGTGIGARASLAQYVAKQLSREFRANPVSYPIEAAFLSNQAVTRLVYRHGDEEVVSSATSSGYDLALFRLRPTP